MSNDKSIVGDLINFRGLVYAPMNENGVVFLFGKVAEDLNMYIEEIKPGFPDCIARRFEGKGWERLRVEFEFRSSNFRQHKHDPKECDLIVCWEHDWKDCPLEVIELKDRIKELENRSTQRPDAVEVVDEEGSVYKKFNKSQRELFGMIVEHVKSADDSCFYKAGKTLLSIYSPKRAFVYVRPMKKALSLWIYTGGAKLGRVKAFGYEKAAHKWGRLNIESASEFEKAKSWISESLVRINVAVKNNEPTGWYAKIEDISEDE